MEVIEPQAIRCELVNVGCFNQTAETTDLCEADIVEQEDDDIRSILVRLLVRGPPLLGIVITLGNNAAEAFDALLLFPIDHDDARLVDGLGRRLRFATRRCLGASCKKKHAKNAYRQTDQLLHIHTSIALSR